MRIERLRSSSLGRLTLTVLLAGLLWVGCSDGKTIDRPGDVGADVTGDAESDGASDVVDAPPNDLLEDVDPEVAPDLQADPDDDLSDDAAQTDVDAAVSDLRDEATEPDASADATHDADDDPDAAGLDIVTDLSADVAIDVALDLEADIDVVEDIAVDVVEDIAIDVVEDIAVDVVEDIAIDVETDIAIDVETDLPPDGDPPVCTDFDEDDHAIEGGACGPLDCNDDAPLIHPDADEVCNGIDDDCDRGIDEGLPGDCLPCAVVAHSDCSPGDVRACGSDAGECVAGVEPCDPTGAWSGICEGATEATDEVQDGLDNNCDGEADEGFWQIVPLCSDGGAVWRVDGDAAGGGDGLSWDSAFDTLPAALSAAAPCDEIWVRGATYALGATVAITQAIQIYGGFEGDELAREERDPAAHVTTFDGGGVVHCFDITADTLLDGVTVANCFELVTATGDGGGAIFVSGAGLQLHDVTLLDNWTDATGTFVYPYGGAVLAESGASLQIEGSHFEANDAKTYGGAVAAIDSSLLVRDSSFVANELDYWEGAISNSTRGGAIYSFDAESLAVVDSLFEGNRSQEEGAAIFANQTDLVVLGSTFRNNVSLGSSSGVGVFTADTVIHGSLFEGNGTPVDYDGWLPEGVLYSYGSGHLTVSDCDFVANEDPALEVYGATGAMADIFDSHFTGNLRSIRTRAVTLTVSGIVVEGDRSLEETVWLSGTHASVVDSRFEGNRGRAVETEGALVQFDRCTFVSNDGHSRGGAMRIDASSTVDVVNSVFADNFTDFEGSVAMVVNRSHLRMAHVTLVGNSVADDLGAVISTDHDSTAALTNGLAWANWPALAMWESSSGRLTPTGSVVPLQFGWDAPELGNLIVDPALVDPAAGDFRLSPGSPAIDGGLETVPDPPGLPTVDFGGRARALDGDGDDVGLPDPGAYEYVVPVTNLPPIALVEDGLVVDANGVPLSRTTLNGGRTCDPNDDPLTYLWYGPRGQLAEPSPEALLPLGTAIITLVTADGTLASNPSTVGLHVRACQALTATPSGGGAELSWTAPATATVFRAPGSDPSGFRIVAQAAASGHQDGPPEGLDVALYAVSTDDGSGPCASDIVALFVGESPPTNADPIIYSTPSDYGAHPNPGTELPTVFEAVFAVPYGYHVGAADPDGDVLSFALLAGPTGMVVDESSGVLQWLPDQTGVHEVSVEVSDGNGGAVTQSFAIWVDNRAPLADAGRDVTLAEAGVTVTLDGGGSADPDGDALSFAWKLISAPTDSLAVLSDPAAERPAITLDRPGRYLIALTVSDESLTSLPDFVTVATMDLRPVALTNYRNIPGEFESTHERGQRVQLDGTESWDAEGRPLSYDWSFRQRPVGSSATLDDPTDARPSFVADVFGRYDLQLVVSDGAVASFPDYAYTAVRNRDPVADAGPDRAGAIGETITFDCWASSDPDGEPLICRWWLVPPGGSSVWFEGHPPNAWAEAFEVSFVPDRAGTYFVQHQVEDPSGELNNDDAIVAVAADIHPPSITTSPPLAADEGAEWSYPAEADDIDAGDTEAWSLDQAPTGMVVDGASGLVTWTPGADDVGDQLVLLRVTDGAGLFDVQSFTLSVAATPRAPRMGCPAVVWVDAGDLLVLRLEAHDPNGAAAGALTFEKVDGPSALTVDPDSGLVAWETAGDDAGDYAVSARVVDPGGLDADCAFTVTVVASEQADRDFDGVTGADGDCDDDDPSVYPGGRDVAGDGIDQDCVDGDALRSVLVDGPTETIEMLVGEAALVTHLVSISRSADAVDGIELLQGVFPADAGLGLESDLPATPATQGSQTLTASARLFAETPDDYEFVTRVTDVDTGQVVEVVTPVRVLAGATRARLLSPGFSPGAVPVGETGLVDVAVRLTQSIETPDFLWLDRTDTEGGLLETVGWLTDLGEGADLAAGDGVYSGTIEVTAEAEGSLWFRAETDAPAGTEPIASAIAELIVTRFTIGAPIADLDDLVYHPTSGAPILAGEVSVVFWPDTTPDEIESAAAALGGTVTGFLPSLGVHVLSFPSVSDGDELVALLAAIRARPEVESADSSGLVRTQLVEMPDPLQLEVAWTETIRSTEAWTFGLGGRTSPIAVVDTGLDWHHPDHRRNHRLGRNLYCPRNQTCLGPFDNHAHGTRVTGVIVAEGNDVGIAGMLPESAVWVVKAFDEEGRTTTNALSDGLIDAVNRGVRVINLSGGQFRGDAQSPMLLDILDARTALAGALLVAAAGNENQRRRRFYPAASPNTLSVGGVGIESDQRWNRLPERAAGSNYGDWIDIAAPAEAVYVTEPTDTTHDYSAETLCQDLAAVGTPLLETLAERQEKGCYGLASGTSMATPMVAGAAGLLLARFPDLSGRQIRHRLEQTAHGLTEPEGAGLGHGRLDVAQALFNGSFEAEEPRQAAMILAGQQAYELYCSDQWDEPGSNFDQVWLESPCYPPHTLLPDNSGWHLFRYGGIFMTWHDYRSSDHVPGGVRVQELGSIRPTHGDYMAMLSTGRGDESRFSIYDLDPDEGGDFWTAHYLDILEQRFTIAPGQTELVVAFSYDFITQEHVRAGTIGTSAADYLSVVLDFGDHIELVTYVDVIQLEMEDLLTERDDVGMPDDFPVRHTGWRHVLETIPNDPTKTGPVTLRFAVGDEWDRAFDSIVLIDDVRVE